MLFSKSKKIDKKSPVYQLYQKFDEKSDYKKRYQHHHLQHGSSNGGSGDSGRHGALTFELPSKKG